MENLNQAEFSWITDELIEKHFFKITRLAHELLRNMREISNFDDALKEAWTIGRDTNFNV